MNIDHSSHAIRVVVADDHPLLRHGIRGLLGTGPDLEIVGEAVDGRETIELVRNLAPDIVLVDVHLPIVDGFSVTRQIKRDQPNTAVILLDANEDEEDLFEAIKVGAAAFYRNDIEPDRLLDGIRRVCTGEYLINEAVITRPLVASRVLQQFRDLSALGQEVEPLFVPLSAREIEVLDYIARGNSNKEIARALKISDQTVKNHITSILRKLAVNDRTQAVVYALRRGWIKLDAEEP
jgi:DNA-binding NarL/FixJ family response regulator